MQTPKTKITPLTITIAIIGVALLSWNIAKTPVGNHQDKIDTANWNLYHNETYGFSLSYPVEFDASAHVGTSDIMGEFLSVDIGTAEYLDMLANPGPGRGGYIYFRLTVNSKNASQEGEEKGICPEGGEESTLKLSGHEFQTCEFILSMGGQPSIRLHGKKDGLRYSIESQRYSEDDRVIIDGIVQSLSLH